MSRAQFSQCSFRAWLAVILSVPVFTCVSLEQDFALADLKPESEAKLQAIADGYRANVESFPIVSCEFQIEHGWADSVEDAVVGGRLKEATLATGLWIVDHEKMRYELQVAPEVMEREKKSPWLQFMPTRTLVNGVQGIGYNPLGHVAPLYSEAWPPDGWYDTPFVAASSGKQLMLHNYIAELSKDEKFSCAYGGSEERNGLRLMVIQVGPANRPSKLSKRFYVDPARGFLPIERESEDTDYFGYRGTRITDVKEFPGGRWFPMRSVQYHSQGDPQGRCKVIDYRVTKLEVDVPPPAEAFAIAVDRGTRVHDPAVRNSEFMIPLTQKVGLADLDRLLARTEQARAAGLAQMRAIQAQQQHAQELPPARRWWLIGMNAVLVAAAIALFAWSRRRSGTRTSGQF